MSTNPHTDNKSRTDPEKGAKHKPERWEHDAMSRLLQASALAGYT